VLLTKKSLLQLNKDIKSNVNLKHKENPITNPTSTVANNYDYTEEIKKDFEFCKKKLIIHKSTASNVSTANTILENIPEIKLRNILTRCLDETCYKFKDTLNKTINPQDHVIAQRDLFFIYEGLIKKK